MLLTYLLTYLLIFRPRFLLETWLVLENAVRPPACIRGTTVLIVRCCLPIVVGVNYGWLHDCLFYSDKTEFSRPRYRFDSRFTLICIAWICWNLLTSINCRVFSARSLHYNESSRNIATMFARLSVCLSVCLGRTCIAIIHCTLDVYGWIVQCSGHPGSKAYPPIPGHRFSSKSRWRMDVQIRRDISRTVENRR